ncbi:MAG: isochorismatase family protein [Streptosporangiaceae bacterium]
MPHSQQEMEAFFRERGFGRTMGFGDRPALVVIDLIRAFTNPDLPLGAPLDDQLAATRRLLEGARRRGAPVFFTTVAYDEPDLRDAGVWALKQSGTTTLRAGTPEVEIDPRLERRGGEQLIVKKYASAFFGTDLISRLNALRVDTLLLAGCTTSGCVRATAVDGLQNGFRVMVVREAVGDRAEAAHTQSLFDLHAKYADVVTLDETLTYLKGDRAAPPEGSSS